VRLHLRLTAGSTQAPLGSAVSEGPGTSGNLFVLATAMGQALIALIALIAQTRPARLDVELLNPLPTSNTVSDADSPFNAAGCGMFPEGR